MRISPIPRRDRVTCGGVTLLELMTVVIIISILVTTAIISYEDRRVKAQYRAALVNVRVIIATVKAYSLSQGYCPLTGNTSHTNSILGLFIVDDYFKNYRVSPSSPSNFNVSVQCGQPGSETNIVFNTNATRIACSGSDCSHLP